MRAVVAQNRTIADMLAEKHWHLPKDAATDQKTQETIYEL